MDKKERSIKLLTLIMILVLAWILYRALIVPKQSGLRRLKESLRNIDRQISQVLGEEVTLSGGAEEVEKVEKYLTQLVLQIPSEKDLPRIINQLLTVPSKNLKIDYSLVQPQKLKTEGRYKRLPIELQFSTSYTHFIYYLTRLKNMPEIFRIDSLDMRRSPADPQRLELSLVISAFVMPREGEEKAEAISGAPYPKVESKVSPFKPKAYTGSKDTESGKAPASGEPIAEEESEAVLNLQGILQSGPSGQNLKAAIINDHIVYVDDKIEGWRVINIKESNVVLRKGARKKILKLIQ